MTGFGSSVGSVRVLQQGVVAAGAVSLELSLLGYASYRVLLSGVVVSVAWANVFSRLSDDGGATFKAGAADYAWMRNAEQVNGNANAGSNADNKIYLDYNLSTIGSRSIVLDVLGAGDAGCLTSVFARCQGKDVTPNFCNAVLHGQRLSPEINNAIKIFPDAGTFSISQYQLLGVGKL